MHDGRALVSRAVSLIAARRLQRRRASAHRHLHWPVERGDKIRTSVAGTQQKPRGWGFQRGKDLAQRGPSPFDFKMNGY